MFVNFSEETRHILKQAEKESELLKHPYVGSEHLFLSLLKYKKISDILRKNDLTYNKFKNMLINLVGVGSKNKEFILYTPLLKKIIENSVMEAREENNKNVNPEILIISILEEEDGIAFTILKNMSINIDKLYFDLKNNKKSKDNKHKKSILDDLGVNLTKLSKEKKLDPVIGRDDEISRTIEILLRRKKNNPMLIGPAGVGKTAIVEGIANLIVSKKCPLFLKNKKIISLNIFSIVSGTKYRGEFEEKMKSIIRELEENDDIILFIDEIHTMVGAGGAEGAIDASNIFKPALARGIIKIIGATTVDEYKKYIEPDAALSRRFQNVMINEPSSENVIKILTEIKPLYEKFHNIKITDDLIKMVASLSKKYLTNRFEPDRSIDILDEVCAKTSVIENKDELNKKELELQLKQIKNKKEEAIYNNDFKRAYLLKENENDILNKLKNIRISPKTATKKIVYDVIKSKGNISVLNVDKDRLKFYDKINKNLNSIVIGQSSNITLIINSLKKKEIVKKRECFSILLTGPHGTGKTLLSESFLKLIGNNIIRLDLKEYKEYHTISKLIGTTAGYLGYDNKNNVFEKIRTNPSSSILIDNYEYACDEVKNVFIRILEDQEYEDASGRMIDFSNTILVFTSTTNTVNKTLGFNKNENEDLSFIPNKLLDNLSLKIKMNKINEMELKELINIKLTKIINKYNYIKVTISDEYKDKILRKIIPDKVNELDNILKSDLESKIIDAIINRKNSINITCNNKKSNIHC